MNESFWGPTTYSHSSNKEPLLMIFVKNPQLGKVKTRLAQTIGEQKALAVYQQLLYHTFKITQSFPFKKTVFYDTFIDSKDLWNDGNYQKCLQQGRDLGERMSNAFEWGFLNHYSSIVIIGSDCPELSPEILKTAFTALLTHDFVVGPAKDGGYYLLGMKKPYDVIFKNKEWSGPLVMQQTLKDLQNLNASIYLLPVLSDIDTEKDLQNYSFAL